MLSSLWESFRFLSKRPWRLLQVRIEERPGVISGPERWNTCCSLLLHCQQQATSTERFPSSPRPAQPSTGPGCQFLKEHFSMNVSLSYSVGSQQWAAVRTQLEPIREPPQTNPSGSDRLSCTWYWRSLGEQSAPPMILFCRSTTEPAATPGTQSPPPVDPQRTTVGTCEDKGWTSCGRLPDSEEQKQPGGDHSPASSSRRRPIMAPISFNDFSRWSTMRSLGPVGPPATNHSVKGHQHKPIGSWGPTRCTWTITYGVKGTKRRTTWLHGVVTRGTPRCLSWRNEFMLNDRNSSQVMKVTCYCTFNKVCDDAQCECIVVVVVL